MSIFSLALLVIVTAEAGKLKYPLIGCADTTGFSSLDSNAELSVKGIEECLDSCNSSEFVFGGLECPQSDGTVNCRCHSGRPASNDYWVTPQDIKMTNNASFRCNATSASCDGRTVVGGYFAGGDGLVAVYGLIPKGENMVEDESFRSIASLPKQPAMSSNGSDDTCPNVSGLLDFSSLVPSGSSLVDIIVPNETDYLVTTSIQVGKLWIGVGASLVFSDKAGLTLNASQIDVWGALRVGTATCPLRSGDVTINLIGVKPSNTKDSTKGIVVHEGGVLDMHGIPFSPTWTRLRTEALPGTTTLELQQHINWKVGQKVLVLTSSFIDEQGDHQNEVRTITSVNENAITLDQPLLYGHYGGPEYFAEVALLSRSVTIQGDEVSEDNAFGGHTVCFEGSICRLSFIRGFRMGQMNVIGRYPFHYHLMGNVAGLSYFRGLSVEHSYFRAFVIHGSSNASVSSCVAYDVMGSALYLEDGVEEDNLISYNLIAHVHVIKPHANPWIDYDPPGGTFDNIPWIVPEPDRVVPSDLTPAAFYCTNPRNIWIGNVASGGFTGFIFPVVSTALGQSYATAAAGYEPMTKDLLQFDGNTAHSSGQWFMNGACIYVGAQIINPYPENVSHQEYYYWKFGADTYVRGLMEFNNTLLYSCRAGFKSWGFDTGLRPHITIRRTEFHDMMLGVAFFGENAIVDSIFTARTRNTVNAFNTYTPAIGFQLYDTLFQTVFKNTVFRGYKGPGDLAMYQGVLSDCCSPTGMLGAYQTLYVDTPFENRLLLNPDWNKVDSDGTHPWQWANAQDLDGTITGLWNGAILGAGDEPDEAFGWNGTREWFHLDETCELLFTSHASRGYWACPKAGRYWALQERTVVTIITINSDVEIGCSANEPPYHNWARACSQFTKTDSSTVLTGTLYHFGHTERFAAFGWSGENAAKHIVGSCCDIGWYMDVEGGSPATFQLHLDQMVPVGGLIFATRYPSGANITAQKCFGGKSDTYCYDLQTSTNKSDFFYDSMGYKFYLETDPEDGAITLFIKLVNEKNEWFDMGDGARILASDFYFQARYVVRSNKTGPVSLVLPPEDWIAELVSATASPTLIPTSSAPTTSPPTQSPMNHPSPKPTPVPTELDVCYTRLNTDADTWYCCLGSDSYLGGSWATMAEADECYIYCQTNYGDSFRYFMYKTDSYCKCRSSCSMNTKSSSPNNAYIGYNEGVVGERCDDDKSEVEAESDDPISAASATGIAVGGAISLTIAVYMYRRFKVVSDKADRGIELPGGIGSSNTDTGTQQDRDASPDTQTNKNPIINE